MSATSGCGHIDRVTARPSCASSSAMRPRAAGAWAPRRSTGCAGTASSELGLHRIYAYVLAINPAARRPSSVPGFALEGTLRDDRWAGDGSSTRTCWRRVNADTERGHAARDLRRTVRLLHPIAEGVPGARRARRAAVSMTRTPRQQVHGGVSGAGAAPTSKTRCSPSRRTGASRGASSRSAASSGRAR